MIVLPEANFKEEDLPVIEERMHEIADRNIALLTHRNMPKDDARELYKNNPLNLN